MLTDGRTDGRTDARTDGRTDGRTDDGRKVITIAHPEQSSGELKKNSAGVNVTLALGSHTSKMHREVCSILQTLGHTDS